MKERLYEILNEEKVHEIIPFLKELSPEERKTLVPTIKKMDREISKIIMTKNSYHTAGSVNQHSIIDIASFVCMDQKNFGKNYWSLFRNIEQTDKILEWGCPNWFSDFINESVDAEFTAFTYQDILGWVEKGYVKPKPELLGHHLSNYPSDLDQHPDTLATHFWYLCEFPSKSLPFRKEWFPLVQKLVTEQKIDRKRFLRECLLASNRNFNKNVTGWFMDAFTALKPTDDELIALQNELLAGLTSVQSKAINTILTHLKKIVATPAFKSDEFSHYLPNLLSSEVKTVVVASLALTEKIFQHKRLDPEMLGMALSTAFVSKDDGIQSKAAKIILKYIPVSENIKEALSHYSDNILTNVRPALAKYIEEKQSELEAISSEKLYLTSSENKLKELESFEDLMFFLPLAIEDPYSYHCDIALAGFIRFAGEVDAESVKLIEPVFLKACKTISKWEVPYLNVLLCNLIINYGLNLLEKFPIQLKNLEKIYHKTCEEEAAREAYSGYHKKIGPVEKVGVEGPASKAFKEFAILASQKIKEGDTVPLLFTITHNPCWISPVTLVERLEIYQNNNIEPHHLDIQLALQRCALDDTAEAIQWVEKRLKGEFKDLLLFFFGKNAVPKGKFEHPAWWMTAGITRSPGTVFQEFSDFGYDNIPAEFFSGAYSWKTIDNKKNSYYPVELSIVIPKYHLEKRKNPLFMEYFVAEQKELSEIPALMWCFPNTPANALAKVIKHCLFYSGIAEVYERNLVLNTTKALYQVKKPLDEIGYLFLGTIFLDGDKTIRGTAAEIWLEHVSHQMIDNAQLGKVIGLHEKLEWAPVKRLTDLMQNHMLNVSKNHNLALEKLISNIILQMEKPVTNLKKLLEVYHEVLALNQSEADPQVKEKLNNWKENSSLKKICNLLLKK
ncbi:hypothetical protein C1637_09280 [Chryseobacterium lactis]|uniref:Uncharacterized protein n=1 Tax=Chryseobacterium lactis TaxID=1241981 RepID=A0A3G6RIA3_CHRLC|nr:DUF6493 family protein [Chryseobacterium lactis]AZA82285.1 hypothetical protein EG342_10425 [Chryseobacterium lactis]AZB02667.1 hypothetical protein EG341_01285 [Chryseobacterium lactis]PNW14041.1 hypothetical protein C1637_09280 [Chryseobacterium lactis]